jgi:hypothetical protein
MITLNRSTLELWDKISKIENGIQDLQIRKQICGVIKGCEDTGWKQKYIENFQPTEQELKFILNEGTERDK